MGRNADALSEKQIETLEWIRDGCEAVDAETEVSRRISAASLKSRGLATVRGAGVTWKASITPAGRTWLETHSTAAAIDVGGPDDLITSVLEEGVASGQLRRDLPVKVATKVLFGAMDQVATSWVLGKRAYRLVDAADAVATIFLRGVTPDGV